MSPQTTDVLVIGSGFGGAIPAYHLAAAEPGSPSSNADRDWPPRTSPTTSTWARIPASST